ncbi:Laccase-2 [Cyphellophora attinorum]|uniref:laccase n=1 Tax=Cyphellophora attinorum TaxID=1664694 RepID=A0A0N1H6H2_9EURO|nr:Laccase-2 [Phialophora attinorum]KPI37805.1 Laccase-2 [Phialophora attinorum]
MGIKSVLSVLAAIAAVNAGVCPAQKPVDGIPGWAGSGAVDNGPAKAYGNLPASQPSGGAAAPNSPAQPPDASLSTSEDAKNNPNAPNSAEHRGNWAAGFDINTDYTQKWPTGKTVQATFTITNSSYAPDGGAPQEMFLINGQYPGPLLEGNWGDIFEVTVINQLQNNGTGIHWHGFRQLGNNVNDGVSGVTECPIPPGGEKVYRFQATGYVWQRCHWTIVVHGPASANYDIDLGSVMMNEIYEGQTIFQVEHAVARTGPANATNYLVNGKNIKPDLSSGEREQFKFTPGKKHLMRFVNTAVDSHFKVQLDGHKLLVIANDNVPITPYYTTEVSIGIGERYDIVIEADQDASAYYLRTIPTPGCSLNANNGLGSACAVVVYDGSSASLPTSSAPATIIVPVCNDEPLANLIPIVEASVDGSDFAKQFAPLPVGLRTATLASNEQVFLWYLNGVSQSVDWSRPTVREVSGNVAIADAGANLPSMLPAEWSLISLPNKAQWYFWVIQNQFFAPHPMHLHGHDFAVLGQGNGNFNPDNDMDSLNFKNPTRRDSVMLLGSGWTVIAFQADNPGSWLMHCHIAFHVSQGLSLEFVELPDQMPSIYGSQCGEGTAFDDQCSAWGSYDQSAVYPKSDSGLKRRGWGQNEHMKEARNMDAKKMHMLNDQMVKRALM